MRIEHINIKNFKGIKSYEGEINGKNMYLIGANESGKTSIIDAIWSGLDGKGFPPEPTHNGAKNGLIEIDLGDMIARTKLRKGKAPIFELENKESLTDKDKFIAAPRTYLANRLGILNFNINEFFAKSDLEQVKYFSKIMNIDFSDIDSEIEEAEESRKFDKRKLAELKKDRGFYDEELAKREIIDVVQLAKDIEAEKDKAARYDKVNEGVIARDKTLLENKKEIEDLLAKIEAIKTANRALVSEIFDGNEWLSDSDNEPDKEKHLLMIEKLNTANETNKKITEAKTIAAAEKESEEYEKLISDANEFIEEKRSEKAVRISEKINIDGLKYDSAGERFLYNGLPFDSHQINTASQLIAGMKIASTILKDLKILRVDASLIDKVQFDKVLEWSEKNDIELFVELVDREAEGLRIVLDEQ